MARDLLYDAADEVDATREEMLDTDANARLASLADRLRTQADREATPALGALDRIQYALREIAADADDEVVSDRLENARERIFAFLETLDDRGMKQHEGTRHTDPDNQV